MGTDAMVWRRQIADLTDDQITVGISKLGKTSGPLNPKKFRDLCVPDKSGPYYNPYQQITHKGGTPTPKEVAKQRLAEIKESLCK